VPSAGASYALNPSPVRAHPANFPLSSASMSARDALMK